jgi:hypothetical protein
MQWHLLIIAALGSFVTGCTVTLYSEEYKKLQGLVETNPSEDALVGMWTRREVSGSAVANNAILFRSDHTGITKFTADDSDPLLGWMGSSDNLTSEIGAFNWNYVGNGMWQMKNSKGRIDECRLAQGKLLRVFRWYGPKNYVYEKVD